MKKLLFGICIAYIISACNSTNKTPAPMPQKVRISLNGYKYDIANKMVAAFKKDSSSSAAATAVWFSKEWVDSVAALLNREKATGTDGFRIFFAKKNTGENTVIVVSTRDDGPDMTPPKNDHLDYFAHDQPFLSMTKAVDSDEYNKDPGATLYSNPDSTGSCAQLGPNYISCHNASIAVDNFKKVKWINTHSEWFSICYINYLKNELDKAPKNVMADGIRIYFAYHDKTTNPNHPNRHAFIIVPTQTANIGGKIVHRRDNYKCYTTYDCVNKMAGDNGEQCLNNCTGVTLPTP